MEQKVETKTETKTEINRNWKMNREEAGDTAVKVMKWRSSRGIEVNWKRSMNWNMSSGGAVTETETATGTGIVAGTGGTAGVDDGIGSVRGRPEGLK
jgi:hypothetical protein